MGEAGRDPKHQTIALLICLWLSSVEASSIQIALASLAVRARSSQCLQRGEMDSIACSWLWIAPSGGLRTTEYGWEMQVTQVYISNL